MHAFLKTYQSGREMQGTWLASNMGIEITGRLFPPSYMWTVDCIQEAVHDLG